MSLEISGCDSSVGMSREAIRDSVREHIKNTIAEANLGKELSESSLDSRLAALRSQAGDVQAKQQLAELKLDGDGLAETLKPFVLSPAAAAAG